MKKYLIVFSFFIALISCNKDKLNPWNFSFSGEGIALKNGEAWDYGSNMRNSQFRDSCFNCIDMSMQVGYTEEYDEIFQILNIPFEKRRFLLDGGDGADTHKGRCVATFSRNYADHVTVGDFYVADEGNRNDYLEITYISEDSTQVEGIFKATMIPHSWWQGATEFDTLYITEGSFSGEVKFR